MSELVMLKWYVAVETNQETHSTAYLNTRSTSYDQSLPQKELSRFGLRTAKICTVCDDHNATLQKREPGC